MNLVFLLALLLSPNHTQAAPSSKPSDLLIKVSSNLSTQQVVQFAKSLSNSAKPMNEQWIRVPTEDLHIDQDFLTKLKKHKNVLHVQPNFQVQLLTDYSVKDPQARAQINALYGSNQPSTLLIKDNPSLPLPASAPRVGSDPELPRQWGVNDIGAPTAWKTSGGSPSVVVAVLDSGVDYTHPDLLPNLWRNPGESGDKANNGIDDDGNGYVDDSIGWDFVSNDNKPFDLTLEPWQFLLGGGNPGHGTHCAGNVAARGGNGLGISGVAPFVKIMPLRFIAEKGGGTTSDAVGAIYYAVDNGAKILSNSWGNFGEDESNPDGNRAMRDAFAYAQSKGVLVIAAAGNGRGGIGFNNDTDPEATFPASYPYENIISVAAIDSKDQLGSFSNFGQRSVDIGAPGVAIFSTMVDGRYGDKLAELPGVPVPTWDGTSMATPHVAGAAALVWSKNPRWSAMQVKDAILRNAKPVPSLSGKVLSNGKLDVLNLLQ